MQFSFGFSLFEVKQLTFPEIELVLLDCLPRPRIGVLHFPQVIRGFDTRELHEMSLKLQLYDAIYRLQFYSKSLIHILSLSNLHNNVASIQKNRGDKSHRVIVA